MAVGVEGRNAVLVIEDQPVMLLMAVDLVEEAGFEALEATGATEAVRLLETRPDIFLVFSDIDLGIGMDGLALAHAIRDRWPPVEIIMTSGKVHPRAEDLPPRGRFFDKPYRRDEVAAAMRALAA
ncbi:response regulator [Methylorubrum thiocyanatum]|uniref:CheY-like chemotaxis protein n=1 Tax=Methylorubrum thiocyanatum TaxID=47958 RepID=A0AA40S5X6_9HYPH|nr:response regulator [Methylorubrum thiocyanatum]MBA8915125.1 CheY-like chemotaxis protein [Methylorubrum thiocyanatum]GJE79529.1 Blue-light-activated protein [Methylorubrum thiocyanatum]